MMATIHQRRTGNLQLLEIIHIWTEQYNIQVKVTEATKSRLKFLNQAQVRVQEYLTPGRYRYVAS